MCILCPLGTENDRDDYLYVAEEAERVAKWRGSVEATTTMVLYRKRISTQAFEALCPRKPTSNHERKT